MTADFALQFCVKSYYTWLTMYVYIGNDTIDYSLYPNKEYQLEWLRMYLKEVAKIKGNAL